MREQLHVLRTGRAGRQVGGLLVGRVFEQVALGVAALVVAARLGPDAFAPVAVLFIVNSAAVTLSDWGVGLAVLRRPDGEQLARRLRHRMHAVNGVIACVGIAVGAAIGGEIGTVVAASGVIWWASAEAFVSKAAAINSGHGRRAAAAEMVASTVLLIAILLFADGTIAIVVVGAALVAKHVLEIVVAYTDAGFASDGLTPEVRALWGTQAVALGVANVDYLLVGLLLGAEAFSVYTVGYRIAVVLPSVLAYVGTRAALADLGAETDSTGRQTRYLAYVRPLFALGVAAAAVTVVVGIGLAAALGAEWELVWPTVLVLACSAPWRMVFGQAGALALSVRASAALIRWQLVQLGALSGVIAVAAVVAGLPGFVTAVAVVWIASTTAIERAAARVAAVPGWARVSGLAWIGVAVAILAGVVGFR
jgi:PST family polysaccharide transporter